MKFYRRRIKHPGKFIRRLIPGNMLAFDAREKLKDIYFDFHYSPRIRKVALYELELLWWRGIPDEVIKKIDGYRLETVGTNAVQSL